MQVTIKQFLGEDPSKSADFGRIVNNRHFKRVLNLLKVVYLSAASVLFVCHSVRLSVVWKVRLHAHTGPGGDLWRQDGRGAAVH